MKRYLILSCLAIGLLCVSAPTPSVYGRDVGLSYTKKAEQFTVGSLQLAVASCVYAIETADVPVCLTRKTVVPAAMQCAYLAVKPEHGSGGRAIRRCYGGQDENNHLIKGIPSAQSPGHIDPGLS